MAADNINTNPEGWTKMITDCMEWLTNNSNYCKDSVNDTWSCKIYKIGMDFLKNIISLIETFVKKIYLDILSFLRPQIENFQPDLPDNCFTDKNYCIGIVIRWI